ncbi:mitogen-activated protein kinase kinase kinase 18-like [Nicotiana tabacum]|uniref:Mitogen-activated protein kinase kinase kinase 18-like n=2 Tax=Nicotiana TaxID=4085 RepID=A0A1S3Y3A8_TOBAC|nr:PREDICTED: mitogen-activated protein kinase kinase kinase A-like [Nicotiana sylvestris]XP_016446693.1 PREDICTED: mitogen-activated protein kinase kinase kinase A-like [Nicotiana tabacum]
MDWIRGATIGHGSSAAVSIAVSRCSGEIFAVKSVELSQSECLQKEQKILSTLSSPYIVGYKGYDVTGENNEDMLNLMMEYMPGGTLTHEIGRQGGRLNEQLIGYFTKQIIQGLDYLHSKGLVHCDIKGRNILLCETGAKIADFGCARSVDQAKWNGGTPMFMAPEVARGEEQGFAADIWALGCTIIEMATGASPWTTVSNPASLLYHIAFSGQNPEIPEFLSSKTRDFVSKCLTRDPKQRWSAKQLLSHPFLEESDSNSKVDEEFITSSPTSILDQRIWNSAEESETVNNSTQTISSMDSPLQRVTKLCTQSGKPEWRWDESWITVRNCSENNRGDGGNLVSKMLEINCIDSLFCCSTSRIQHRAVISSLNFDRHIRSSVNKITH